VLIDKRRAILSKNIVTANLLAFNSDG
jgi:hypothetical protein